MLCVGYTRRNISLYVSLVIIKPYNQDKNVHILLLLWPGFMGPGHKNKIAFKVSYFLK